jgi:hypothetical protein
MTTALRRVRTTAQFFCSKWRPSFLFAGRARAKVIWCLFKPLQQVDVDELRATANQ